MLKRLRIQGFKSLHDIEVSFPKLTVLFGTNAAGKSNILDAIQVLSRTASERTIEEALSGPIRGHPIEFFSFPQNGLPALLEKESAQLSLDATIEMSSGSKSHEEYQYSITACIHPRSGSLSIVNEYLAKLSKSGVLKGKPLIESNDRQIFIRRKSKPAHPRTEAAGLNHTQLSDARFSGLEYSSIERTRKELVNFRSYYLDPRVAMRMAAPPREVTDIGPLGENLTPFLYRLRLQKKPYFDAIRRALHSLIPSVESLHIDLDEKRGTLDLQVVQEGITFSSRIISEGTLRVLALCAIVANPWPGTLIAFEEPENGVHPRRLELIAQLFHSLSLENNQQVIITTHSPIFCQQILKFMNQNPHDISILVVRKEMGNTVCIPFHPTGPLFEDHEIREALTSRDEDGWFEGLVRRGLIDG